MATDPLPDTLAAGPPPPEIPAPRSLDFLAAVLSYLVPGLGQIYQGRVGKGVLFMVALLGMFFFGMYLGDWKNVYVPGDAKDTNFFTTVTNWLPIGRQFVRSVGNGRLAFGGQMWIGAAAWPAILQYNDKWPISDQSSKFWHEFQKSPSERILNEVQAAGNKTWDLGWVYTVIAGVLNILVIYDALAGAAFIPAAAGAQAAAAAPKASAPQEPATV